MNPRDLQRHQFVVYGDCTSGIPDGPHEATFASVNAVVARLSPSPDFVCFLGDEIKGLLADEAQLREQWRYWFEDEMGWLDREAIPLYHTTANHTTYDGMSERVFCDVLSRLPQNGPSKQRGLSYFVRRGDLLLIFVNTMWSGLGGEGMVETEWLTQTLTDHADARHKLVLGHHPVWGINGYVGDHQRTISAENGRRFWQILVQHNVLAYLCSHLMAFDVQVHEGVLQILTAGAGTLPLMPSHAEYLHAVQMALDVEGLRYQVLDTNGQARESLAWPFRLPPSGQWQTLLLGEQSAAVPDLSQEVTVWRFDGVLNSAENGSPQTLLCAWDASPYITPFWIGLTGRTPRVSVQICPEPGRSPRHWLGPQLQLNEPFSIQICLHPDMGPGGILWRWHDDAPWSSMLGTTAWGANQLASLPTWGVGQDNYGQTGRPFRSRALTARLYHRTPISKQRARSGRLPSYTFRLFMNHRKHHD